MPCELQCRVMKIASALLLLFASVTSLAQNAAPAQSYLYRASMVQAAPGKLLELIDLYKAKAASDAKIGDAPAFWMRHSQGDRWDLLLLTPMSSYAEYFGAERIRRRDAAAHGAAWADAI